VTIEIDLIPRPFRDSLSAAQFNLYVITLNEIGRLSIMIGMDLEAVVAYLKALSAFSCSDKKQRKISEYAWQPGKH
jgi:hypothetical protein